MKEVKNLKQKNSERPRKLPAQKYRLGGVWLNVLPDDLWLRIPRGESVWEALQNTDVELESDCGGMGTCGKCKITVLSGIDPPSIQDRELLDEKELEQGVRLACRTRVLHDMEISTVKAKSEQEYLRILTTSHHLTSQYIPTSELAPLISQQPVALPPDIQQDGLSDLDAIKLGLGSEYSDLKAPLGCLRTLPQKFKETQSRGTAVLHEHCLLAWQDQDKTDSRYGLVFDIGTSTLVGKLFNLTDGSEVAVTSCLNSQTQRGADVISRLKHIKEHPKGLENLRRLVINDLNQLTTRLLLTAGLQPEDIFIAVAAGNTTMQHILLGMSPASIAEAPFSPVLTDGLIVKAAAAGLRLHPEALLYVMPVKSGYIGGDLLSFVMASGVTEQEDEIILGLDLGTNGEIFLGNGKRLLTCSAAAGPALEGARISHGMIAKAGAIEGVSFEKGDLHYLVIGNISPKGICGSGLVELVAVLLELGVIDYEGLIRPPQVRAAQGLNPRLIKRSGVYDFLIASPEESYDHKPLYLTQRDVRALQLAKGAIAAGIKTLTDELGIRIEDIDRVYLAGAFGNYVSPDSAMRIGLIPRLDPEIISSLGNAASTGASMVLLSKNYWQMANKLTGFIEHIELSARLDFNQYFIEQMDFSKENLLDVYREDVGEAAVMRTIKVEEVMTRDFPTVPATMSLEEMSNMLRDTGHHGFPVLDETGYLFGVATLVDLETSLRSGKADLTVGDIATRELFVAYPDQSLHEVLGATAEDYGRIPIVDRRDRNRLLGVLRRHDIMMAYRNGLAQTGKAGSKELLQSKSMAGYYELPDNYNNTAEERNEK